MNELDDSKLPVVVSDRHIYTMNWTARGIEFLIDEQIVSTTRQSTDYPMQLMLNFYDLLSDHE